MSWNVTITVINGPASGTVTDTVPAGFTITSVTEGEATISCTGAGVNPVVCTLAATPTGAYTVTINVTAPDGSPGSECGVTHQNSVTVTGTNAGSDTADNTATDSVTVNCGSITIAKDTDPESNNVSFDFDGDLGDFDLEDDESILFDNLAAGVYDIQENLPNGWDFDFVSCTGDDLSTITSITRGVRITLAGAEDIVCLFDNDQETTPPPPEEEDEPSPPPPPPVAQVLPAVIVVQPPARPAPPRVAEVQSVTQLPRSGSGGYLGTEDTNLWQIAIGSWLILGSVALMAMRARFNR